MNKKEIIIVQIYENKKTNQRLITIPKKFKQFNVGDYIKIEKVK